MAKFQSDGENEKRNSNLFSKVMRKWKTKFTSVSLTDKTKGKAKFKSVFQKLGENEKKKKKETKKENQIACSE